MIFKQSQEKKLDDISDDQKIGTLNNNVDSLLNSYNEEVDETSDIQEMLLADVSDDEEVDQVDDAQNQDYIKGNHLKGVSENKKIERICGDVDLLLGKKHETILKQLPAAPTADHAQDNPKQMKAFVAKGIEP